MSAPEVIDPIDPIAANQEALAQCLARLRALLEAATQPAGASKDDAPDTHPTPPNPNLRLDQLATRFRLSPFERELLLLTAAPELDAHIGDLLARLNGDPRRRQASFGLALSLLPTPHWSALGPDGPLRRWRLIEVANGDSLVHGALRVDERILHFLCGIPATDDRLRPLFHPLPNPTTTTLPPAHLTLAQHAAQPLRSAPAPCVIQLLSECPRSARAVAARIAAVLAASPFLLEAHDLPESAAEREAIARLWEREAALGGTLAIVESCGHETDTRRAAAWLDQLRTSVIWLGPDTLSPTHHRLVRIELPPPPPSDLAELWTAALGPLAARLNGDIAALSTEFRLNPRDIHLVAAQLQTEFAPTDTAPDVKAPRKSRPSSTPPVPRGELPRRLRALCRAQARTPLETLAQRLEPIAGWDDLVLPTEARQRLHEIVLHARHRHRVCEQWGFAARGSRGLGLAALFSGPSGTGKTMAAEVLARELDLELFRIDLSAVVSKYIGETEKNLRRVFDAAESGVAILLFDEADALFGKRTEVKDSHDRYANIEVSYLLQRMEAYRGVAILTTNLKTSLDTAFLRRLRFIVQFPFPDAAQRAEIWRRVFPAQTPTAELEPRRLAQLNVAGGHIRNIAIGAAVLAAEAGEPVRMKHLHDAARNECAKLERPASEAEFAGWI